MDKLKCIAIDDEPLALKLLEDDLSKIDCINLVQTFHSTKDVFAYIFNNEIDLMFLDIEMPTIKGNDFLKTLEHPPMTIFTTAYENYAVESYELNAIDYLLKPIRFNRLEQACLKAYQSYKSKNAIVQVPKTIFVYAEYNKIPIHENDIIYIEGMKDYIKIFLQSKQKPIITRMTLKKIETLLSKEIFIRVHQSFIISANKITSIKKSKLSINEIQIPIGEKYFMNLMNYI